MLTRLFRKARQLLGRSKPLHTALHRVGLTTYWRKVYERRVLRQGQIQVTLLGQQLLFEVQSARELKRIDSLYHEERLLQQILSTLRPDDLVWDVGANIGVISLILAKSRDVTVHAFEPEPRNFERLKRNIELNGLQGRIVPHRLALGDRTGQISLHVSSEVGAGTHSIVAGKPNSAPESIEVPIDTADSFARQTDAVPQIVKIDVEGAEWQVLQGMETIVASGELRELYIEFHPDYLANQGISLKSITDWLIQRGYRPNWSIDRHGEQQQHWHRVVG